MHDGNRFTRVVCLAAAAATVGCEGTADAFGPDASGAPESTGEVRSAATSGGIRLELNGAVAAFLHANEWGDGRGNVVVDPPQSGVSKKHIASVTPDDAAFHVAGAPNTLLTNLIQKHLGAATPPSTNGAFVTVDGNGIDRQRFDFLNAFVSELRFPALGAGVQGPGVIDFVLSPDRTRTSTPPAAPSPSPPSLKPVNPSAFRVAIPNVDTSRVSKIDPLVFRRAIANGVPGALDVQNLVLTVSEIGVGGFASWYDDFVVHGNSSDGSERPVTVDFLGADAQTVVYELNFAGCGIYALEKAAAPANPNAIPSRIARLYCEQAAFRPM